MPAKKTVRRARNKAAGGIGGGAPDLKDGEAGGRERKRARAPKAQPPRPTTAAGEFVREEVEHVRQGKHGARSPKQAIAIGLSKARRAGVPLPPPGKGQAKERTRRSAERDYEAGQKERKPRSPSRKRSAASRGALKREPRSAASRSALSAQAKRAAAKRRPRR